MYGSDLVTLTLSAEAPAEKKANSKEDAEESEKGIKRIKEHEGVCCEEKSS